MLIYAEATNEVSGPTPEAYAQVNAIRKRADLAPLAGLSKDAFRQAIWKERAHELCFENKAYFDIQRTQNVRKDRLTVPQPMSSRRLYWDLHLSIARLSGFL